jgi:hypothetical protein
MDFKGSGTVTRWFHDRAYSQLTTAQQAFHARLATDVGTLRSLLVVHTERDEALRALRFVDITSELPQQALLVLGIVSFASFFLTILFVYMDATGIQSVFRIGEPSFFFAIAAFVAPLVFVMLYLPIAMLSWVRRILYWDDSAFDYLHTRILVSARPPATNLDEKGAAPPGSTRVIWMKTPQLPKAFGLSRRHSSLYQDREIIAAVIDWIGANCRSA